MQLFGYDIHMCGQTLGQLCQMQNVFVLLPTMILSRTGSASQLPKRQSVPLLFSLSVTWLFQPSVTGMFKSACDRLEHAAG